MARPVLEPGKDANIVVSTGDLLDMAGNNVELAFHNRKEHQSR